MARWRLLDKFPGILVDPGNYNNGARLVTIVGLPMKIHLLSDAQPLACYTPNSIPLA